MRIGILILALIIFSSGVSASCDEGQIDINTASAEKLDEITHVGPKVAGYIIEKRPFDSIDDLVEVAYISEGYLEDIKTQGLACVDEEKIEEEEEEESDANDIDYNNLTGSSEEGGEDSKPFSRKIINLNPKVIKSEDDNENLSKSNYAIYGLVFFCVLLVVLFISRKNKHRKNEFK